jgi:hypothetical protein
MLLTYHVIPSAHAKSWAGSKKQRRPPPPHLELWASLASLLLLSHHAFGQPDYPLAHWNPPACAKWYTSGNGHQFCVIHDMEGYYEASISYLNRCDTDTNGTYNVDASVYYLVNGLQNGPGENDPSDPPAGDITQSVRESNYAWHVRCWNKYMFGTEHEGFVSNPAWYTEAMYQASAALQRYLCLKYGIQMDRNHIIGHNEWQNSAWTNWMVANYPAIDPTCNSHTDPGVYWNWGHFMQLITNGLPPSIITQPASQTVSQGSGTIFTVVATSTNGPLTYQWRFNQINIAGALSSRYALQNVQLTNAGAYAVMVSNNGGPVLSSTAFLSVLSKLTNAAGCILAPAGLVDWWPAEGNALDHFGPYNCSPRGGFSYTSGKQGLAFHFDGSSGYLSNNAPSLAPPWTACMWVNRQNAPGAGAALLGDGTYELKLEQYNGTRQVGLTRFGVGDYSFGYIVPAGAWTHLAFVGTSAGTTLYVNGALQSSLTNTLPLPRAYLGVGYVASSSLFTDYMLGSMDEVLLFNRALSASEISSIYSAGSAGLVRAAEFTSAKPSGTGPFQLSLRGLTGKTFTLYGSTDLANWSFLSTVANPSGVIQYNDPAAGGFLLRFYRATQP